MDKILDGLSGHETAWELAGVRDALAQQLPADAVHTALDEYTKLREESPYEIIGAIAWLAAALITAQAQDADPNPSLG